MAKRYLSNKDETLRVFESDFMEMLTKVHLAVPHLIYVPVVVYMLIAADASGMVSTRIGLFGALGLLLWTATEYFMHRFVFHLPQSIQDGAHRVVADLQPGEAVWGKFENWKQTFYFMAHGVHHDFPNDSKRLVMPPSVSLPLALLFYGLFRLSFGVTLTPAVFAGFLVGYLTYDTIHYSTHHFRPRTALGRFLKKHHFRHHYGDPNKDYGVSSPLWDVLVNTMGSSPSDK